MATVQRTWKFVVHADEHMPSGPRIVAFGSALCTAVANAVPPTLEVVALSSTHCAPLAAIPEATEV